MFFEKLLRLVRVCCLKQQTQSAILADAVEEAVFVVTVRAQVGVSSDDDLDVMFVRTGH